MFLLLASIRLFSTELYPIIDGEKIAYINEQGKIVIPFDFTTNVEIIDTKFNGKTFKSFKLPKEAYFNDDYASVILTKYFWFIKIGQENVLINQKGNVVYNAKSNHLGMFSSGFAPISIKSKIVDLYIEYYNYCDTNGTLINDYSYEFTGPFNDNIALVMNDNMFYYINKSGRAINELSFIEANNFSNGMAAVKLYDKWGYIDKNGIISIVPEFDLAGDFGYNLAKVLIKDRYRFINKLGSFSFKNSFQLANDFSEGLASVKDDNNYWGFINESGDYVINPQFEYAGNFVNGLAPVLVNGKFGYIDTSGKFVINNSFDLANDFRNKLAEVWYEGKMYYINQRGEVVWSFDL